MKYVSLPSCTEGMESVVFCVSFYLTRWSDEERVYELYSLGNDYISKYRYDGSSFFSASFNDYNIQAVLACAHGSKKAEGLYSTEVRAWRV